MIPNVEVPVNVLKQNQSWLSSTKMEVDIGDIEIYVLNCPDSSITGRDSDLDLGTRSERPQLMKLELFVEAFLGDGYTFAEGDEFIECQQSLGPEIVPGIDPSK